jgi:outer membrane lipoprotein carrier protein
MKKLVVTLFAAFAAHTMADDAADLYQVLSNKNTLHASFTQHQYGETGDLIETSQGDVYLTKPNKVRWYVAEPFEQLLVSNGAFLWQYDIELEQAVRRPYPADISSTPLMVLATSLEKLRAQYDITKSSACYVLTTKDTKSMFVSMTLCFNPQNVVQSMRLKDGFGQVTEVLLSDVVMGEDISPETYEFTPPDDIEWVIEDGNVPGI